MRKLILYISLLSLCFCSLNSKAQDSVYKHHRPPKANPWDRVFFGGYLGVQFGVSTFVDVSPLIGYRFTDRFSAGVGLTYQYYHYQDDFYEIETNVYGGRVFGRYFITPNLFGHLEYEYLNLEAFDLYPTRRVDVTGILAGGGYIQRIGEHAGMMAMILYNFTESHYTPYYNPVFRIGVVFGI